MNTTKLSLSTLHIFFHRISGGDTVSFQNYKYYLPEASTMGPGLSFDDNITIPYATAIAFQYLLGSIDSTQQLLLNDLVLDKLNNANQNLNSELDMQFAKVESHRSKQKNSPINDEIDQIKSKIDATKAKSDAFFARLFAFVGESNVADLLLKVSSG